VEVIRLVWYQEEGRKPEKNEAEGTTEIKLGKDQFLKFSCVQADRESIRLP
jgi:hypothetical protein